MFTEGKIKLWMERIWLQWRGVGKLMYIPFIANYIVLPLTCIVLSSASHIYDEGYYFEDQGYYFIPFLSVWWGLMILQEYIEGNGREVIWIYDRQKIFDVLFYFGLYILSVLPLFIVAEKYWEVSPETFLDMLAQGFFYVGIVYAIAMRVKSIAAAVVPILVFSLYSGIFFVEYAEKIHVNDFRTVSGYVILGCILLALGIRRPDMRK